MPDALDRGEKSQLSMFTEERKPVPGAETTHAPHSQAPPRPEQEPETPSRRKTTKAERQEFFLPVSGFVWLYPEEVKVTNHPAFQRLARIYQLGFAHLVYRGATHKRIEHALGTLYVVQRMIEAVRHNSQKEKERPDHRATDLSEAEERFIRLAALLHDIGHIAAGHTIEDELGLIGRHDEDARLDLLFEGSDWADAEGRTLAQLIDSLFVQYVPHELCDVSPSQIVRLLIRKQPKPQDRYAEGQPKPQDRYAEIERKLRASRDIRLSVCRDMIGNTICADLLDYLHRDWYHIGKPRPFDERLLQYMEVRTQVNPFTPDKSNSDSFVISLGRRPKIRTDAVSAILELLEWRYQLAESVHYHRTKLAAAAMLDRALYELYGNSTENMLEMERRLLHLSDEELLTKSVETAREKEREAAPHSEGRERAAAAARLLTALQKRQLFSNLTTRFYTDLPDDVVDALKSTFGSVPGNPRGAADNRNRVLRVLEQDFGLPTGSLTMYCPADVSAKVAEVKVAVGDVIEPFCKYEEGRNRKLSGGHRDAQLHRFRLLWRVHFFIDRRVREQLGERVGILQRAIEKLALGCLADGETYHGVAKSLAREVTQLKGSPWYGAGVREKPLLAAYRGGGSASGSYPLGAPSIQSYIEKDGRS